MLIAQILADESPSPRKFDRNLSRDLETICLKCLEKEPPRRYQTADELAEELRRFLRGEPIAARPVSKAERAWRWCRRRPLVAGLGGTLAAVVLAVAIVAPIIAAYQSKLRSDAETLAGELDVSLDEQRKQTDTANRLRSQAENLNAGLQRAIEEKDRQFRRASALRLAAQAKSLAEESPQLSVLLAAAALQSSRDSGESLVETRQALYDVLATVSGVGVNAHSTPLTAVDASPDGAWCASGDHAGNLRLWRCAAGFDATPVALAAFDDDIVDVRFSRDGNHLFAAASDGVVRAFAVAGQNVERPVREWNCHAALRAIDIGDAGQVAAACDDGRVRLWTLADENGAEPRLFTAGGGSLRSVAVGPRGGGLAAAGEDRKVYLWSSRRRQATKRQATR
jgi:WD40 repeat protein